MGVGHGIRKQRHIHLLCKACFTRLVFVMFAVCALLSVQAQAATCLYISSYHAGYEWNDGIERGLEKSLKGKCNIDRFYMDTKRNQDEAFGQEIALRARAHIEQTRPDILIAADDNASRFLIKPYYRDADIPVVFCGINHSVKPYEYPYSNATGMLEISPVRKTIKYIKQSLENVATGIYLTADVVSQHKEYTLNQETYAEEGITLKQRFVHTMAEWLKAYKQAQHEGDFLIIGNNGGITDWDDAKAGQAVREEGKLFSVSNYEWMSKFALLSVTKLPEEQGEWAGAVALTVLGGKSIADIPVVVNRRWNVYANKSLMNTGRYTLSRRILSKSKQVELP